MILDMGMAGKISEISLDSFVNATEDPDKVIAAMYNLIGEGWEVQRREVEGSFGNPIIMIRMAIRRKGEIQKALDNLRGSDILSISLEAIDDRLDEALTYHVRLDKAAAFRGAPSLWTGGEAIELRLKVVTYPRSRDEAKDILRSAILGSGKGKID